MVRIGRASKERKKHFHVSVKQRNRLLGREKSRAKNQREIARVAVAFV